MRSEVSRNKITPQHQAFAFQGLVKRTKPLQRIVMKSLGAILSLASVSLLAYLFHRLGQGFLRVDFWSGYLLLAISFALGGLSLRKKLLPLPLGRVSYWQKAHQYLGLFSLACFACHVRWPIEGWMESLLATLFGLVAGSGLVSWYVNKRGPKLLSAITNEIPLDWIPKRRNELAREAYSIALTAAGSASQACLAEVYQASMAAYFNRRRGILYRLTPNGSLRRKLIAQLVETDRYLCNEGRQARKALNALITQRDDLDFQEAIQMRMRTMASVHHAVSWCFWMLAIFHAVLVHQFV